MTDAEALKFFEEQIEKKEEEFRKNKIIMNEFEKIGKRYVIDAYVVAANALRRNKC